MTGTAGSTSFVDEKGNAWTANGAAAIQASPTKWGGGSGAFNGTNAYLTSPSTTIFDLSSGDFTLEGYFYRTALTSAYQQLIQKDGQYQASYPQYALSISPSGLLIANLGTGNGTSSVQTFTGSTVISANAYHHLAMCKHGTTIMGFVDGHVEWTTTQTATMVNGGKALYIGYQQGQPAGNYFTGAMNEIRITKGVARYTAAFTPPTAPFPDS